MEAAPRGDRIRVHGELTLAGATAPVAFDLVVRGRFRPQRQRVVIERTDWGISPYSALFGALKVNDEVEVAIDVDLLARVSAPMLCELIRPQELKPALLALDGISASPSRPTTSSTEATWKSGTRSSAGSAQPTPGARGTSRSSSRSRSGGSRTTRSTSSTSAARAGTGGAIAGLIERHFGSAQAWRADLKATGMAGRGWAWTAYDWDEGPPLQRHRRPSNTYPIWNATPLVALDVHEHAYFLDYQTDRGAYIDAFFNNLDWAVVNGWLSAYRIPGPRSR